MNVSAIMTKNPAHCTTDSGLKDVAKLMADNDCGCIPVVENTATKKPVGVITDRDITIRTVAAGKNPLDLTARDIMTSDVLTVKAESSVEDCCNLMEKNQIRRVAVVDENGALAGIVAQADIANNASEQKTAQVVQEVSKST